MAFDLQPTSCETAAAAALAAGVDLRAFVLPAEASARGYGDSYVYDVQALAAFVGQLGSSSSVQQQHQQQQLLLLEAGGDAWSLADAQALLVRSWRVFIEIAVLTQPSKAKHNSSNSSSSGGSNVAPPTPSLSPSRGPVLSLMYGGNSSSSSSSGGGSSKFSGDVRSHQMLVSVATRLADETRTGWAVLVVAREMSEALVSMLHHQ
eukprot:7587-Heterococcus_DN1.PRE.1